MKETKNRYLNAFTKAYESNELYELFSKNEKYIYDDNGRLAIGPDIKLYPDEDLIVNYHALIMSGAIKYYFGLDKKEKKTFKDVFCKAIVKMIDSDSIEQLYDATQIYYILVELEETDTHFPLEGYPLVFKNQLSSKVISKKDFLKKYVIGPEDCRIDGYSRIMDKEKRIKNPEKYSLLKGE